MSDMIPFGKQIDIGGGVRIDGDGTVLIINPYFRMSYESNDISLTLDELEEIVKCARAHHVAYQAYRVSGFDKPVYRTVYDKLAKVVPSVTKEKHLNDDDYLLRGPLKPVGPVTTGYIPPEKVPEKVDTFPYPTLVGYKTSDGSSGDYVAQWSDHTFTLVHYDEMVKYLFGDIHILGPKVGRSIASGVSFTNIVRKGENPQNTLLPDPHKVK